MASSRAPDPLLPKLTKLSVVIPARDEEGCIASTLEHLHLELRLHGVPHEILVVDDGSSDRTWEIATTYAKTRAWLKPYRNERNRGSGYNTKRAISLATKDYVFWQTVDWAYDIRHLAKSLADLNTVDVLQGVRVDTTSAKGMVQQRSDTAYKGLVSVVNYRLVRTLFQLPLGDYQNVTVYPRPLIQSMNLETESAFTNPECLLKTWWRGATFKEVPVPFVKRQRGRGTGTRPKAIAAAIADIIYWWLQWVVLRRRSSFERGRVIR